MTYTKRVVDIIDILLTQKNYVSVSEIAELMKISKRTIFRDMDDVEALIEEQGLKLLKKNKLGIRIEASAEQIASYKKFTQKYKGVYFTQEERLKQIIIELLKSREPRKFYYFSNLLSVSEATISYDMDKVEPWFTEHAIKLVRKPGYGVFLSGKEGDFRKAIVDFLYQNFDHQDLISLLDNSVEFVDSVMDREISMKVSRILGQYEDYLVNRLTDQSYMGLMIHLSIAVQRILRGESIVMSSEILGELKLDAQFEIAKDIGSDIEKVFNIRFPEDELGYITMHLKGSKLKTGALVDQQDMIISNFELSRLSSTMIQKFKELSGYDLREDEKLLIGLVSHLRPAITRMKLSLDIRNPLLDKIIEMYPEIYSMSTTACELITHQFGLKIPEEEIGYVAMHFGAAIERFVKLQSIEKRVRTGVVCSSGVGTSSLLYSRLSKLFPRLELIGQFSKEDVMSDKIANSQIELLITTINLDKCSLPSILVNPLLMPEDIERIKQVTGILSSTIKPFVSKTAEESLGQTHQIKQIHAMTEAVLTVEESFRLYENVKTGNINSLIKIVSETLSSDYKAKKGLYTVLKERERMGSTVLHGEGIILLHAKASCIETLSFTVWRLQSSVYYNAQRNTESISAAIVMLIPNAVTEIQVEMMSQLSKALVEEDTFIEQIMQGTQSDLGQFIKTILHKWLTKQLKNGGLV